MFKFDNSKLYLMPPFFGGYDAHDAPVNDATSVNFVFKTDGRRLADYLPQGFNLLRPELSINYNQLRGVQFLSGGAYNLINVSVPVRFTGKRDHIDGSFTLIVWENDTRPITGGREQSGQPKTFADIQDLQNYNHDYFASASYQNNTFLQFGISHPQTVDPDTLAKFNALVKNYNVFGWRYIPKVGGYGAELSQPILYPQSQTYSEVFTGEGYLDWHKITLHHDAYESDIIWQANIIEQLADLPVYDMEPVTMTKGSLLMSPLSGRVLR